MNTTYKYVRCISFGDIFGPIVQGVGSILGFGASMYGSSQAAGASKDAAREYNRGQLEMQARQNEFNYGMWQENNAYNSPLAQRQRMEAAGLNPNLFDVDTGNSVGPITSADANLMPEGVQAADIQANSFPNAIQSALSMAAASDYAARAEKTRSETKAQDIENNFKEQVMTNFVKLQNLSIDLGRADIDWKRQDIKRLQGACESLQQTIEESKARVSQIMEQIRLMASQRELNYKQGNLLDSQTEGQEITNKWMPKMFGGQYASMLAGANANNAQAGYMRQQTSILSKSEKFIVGKAATDFLQSYYDSDFMRATAKMRYSKFEVSLQYDRAMRDYTIALKNIAEMNDEKLTNARQTIEDMGPIGKFVDFFNVELGHYVNGGNMNAIGGALNSPSAPVRVIGFGR